MTLSAEIANASAPAPFGYTRKGLQT